MKFQVNPNQLTKRVAKKLLGQVGASEYFFKLEVFKRSGYYEYATHQVLLSMGLKIT